MMKRLVGASALILLVSMLTVSAFAAETKMTEEAAGAVEPAGTEADLQKVEQLLENKTLENCLQAVNICESILAKEPKNFDANWLCAKAHREYGEAVKKQELSGWEEICKKHGKTGMGYAQTAIELEPDKVHGYFFYGMNVGIYADGAGIITALREGLKDKTQSNFEKSYDMDKNFEKGGPILALGRFWQVVPFPFTDKDMAMKLYREFQRTPYFKDSVDGHVYLAELLADEGSSMWGKNKNEKEVKHLVAEVRKMTKDRYWLKKSDQIIKDL